MRTAIIATGVFPKALLERCRTSADVIAWDGKSLSGGLSRHYDLLVVGLRYDEEGERLAAILPTLDADDILSVSDDIGALLPSPVTLTRSLLLPEGRLLIEAGEGSAVGRWCEKLPLTLLHTSAYVKEAAAEILCHAMCDALVRSTDEAAPVLFARQHEAATMESCFLECYRLLSRRVTLPSEAELKEAATKLLWKGKKETLPRINGSFLRLARDLGEEAPSNRRLLRRIHQLERKGEGIELNSFLKLKGIAPTGGQARHLIQEGKVKVNGTVEKRNKRLLRKGESVEIGGKRYGIDEAATYL